MTAPDAISENSIASPTGPALTKLAITPWSTGLTVLTSLQFHATGTWSNGSTSTPAVTWSATGGTINSSGLYKAGGALGTYRVIATQSDGTRADTALVTIKPRLLSLTLSPSAATLALGASKQFAVAGTYSDASYHIPPVTYQATGGTITSSGLYTAGIIPGTYKVIAVHKGGIMADTVVVTIPIKLDLGVLPGKLGNLFSNSFETGWGPLTNGGMKAPNGYSIASAGGYSGSHYAQASLGSGSSDQAANMYWNGDTPRNNIWVLVAIKVTTTPNTGVSTQKMVIFRQAGYQAQLGEMNQTDNSYIWNWLDGGKSSVISGAGKISASLGKWNLWKFHLDQTGPKPKLTVGLNGHDNIFSTTKKGAKLADPAIVNFGGTLNAGSGPSQFGFDYIQVSSTDPGWPQ